MEMKIPTALSIFVLLVVAGLLLLWVNDMQIPGMTGMKSSGSQGGQTGGGGVYGGDISGMSSMPAMMNPDVAPQQQQQQQSRDRENYQDVAAKGRVAPGTAAGSGKSLSASAASSSSGVAAGAAAFDVDHRMRAIPGWLADTGGPDDLPLRDGSWGADVSGWGGPGRGGRPPVRAVGGFLPQQ